MNVHTFPIKETVYKDVAVIGGGSAGCFAAISAANAGADTLLVEKYGALGGTITVCDVNFPGLFFAWGKQIIAGPCWDAITRLEKQGYCKIPEISYHPEKHWMEQIRINSFAFCALLDEMCEEAGVEVYLHTMLAHAEEDEEGVDLFLAQKDGIVHVRAKKVIDATADANLATSLGYPVMISPTLQPATLSLRLDGYDAKSVCKPEVEARLTEALNKGSIPKNTVPEKIAASITSHYLRYHVNMPQDAHTSRGKSELERTARRELSDIISVLRTCPGLEGLSVATFSIECGVRETCRVEGEYVITAEDYINGVRFDDAVCYAFYPIDLHMPPYRIKKIYFKEDVCATVPLRALIPKHARHTLVAGRCLSSDTDANSALRVQAVCMATGQAAGCAAAIAAAQNVEVAKVPYSALSDALIKQGAIVPGGNG